MKSAGARRGRRSPDAPFRGGLDSRPPAPAQKTEWRRRAATAGASVATGAAVFAGLATSIYVPAGRPPTAPQLWLAAVASVLSGGVAYWQLRGSGHHLRVGDVSDRGSREHGRPATPAIAGFRLPADVEDFTGRAEYVAELLELISDSHTNSLAVSIVGINGKAGVGKTSLALHVAHLARGTFVDGQLYINLRGSSEDPIEPGAVLTGFLDELGIPAESIPADPDQRARLFRSTLDGRRVLVLLDNVAGEWQVRPLLPAAGGSVVLLTSRTRLSGLEGGHNVALEVMPPAQGAELLAKIVGGARTGAEPDAVRTIARLCGHLPLAIRIAGARIAARPTWRLDWFARRLADERRRLDLLTAGDLEVRASFLMSYRGCSEEEQRAFRLLGVVNAQEFPAWVLAVLGGTTVDAAEAIVERLVDAQLVELAGIEATGVARYRFHDLLRDFARERLDLEEESASRKAALRRLLETYLAWTDEVSALVEPRGLRNTDGSALFTWRANWREWEETHVSTLSAAEAAGDRKGQALLRRSLGVLYREQGRYQEAVPLLELSSIEFSRLHEPQWHAVAQCNLGDVYRYVGLLDLAQASFEASLVVFDRLHNDQCVAWALNGLGDVQRGLSRWSESADSFRRCIAMYSRLGDRHEEARAKIRFGALFRDRCQYGEAERLYREGLSVLVEFDDTRWQARTLRHLGVNCRNDGRTTEALDYLEQALELFHRLVDHRGVATTLRNIGDTHRRSGDYGSALSYLMEALDAFAVLRDDRWRARTQLSLAETWRNLGDLKQARDYAATATAIASAAGDLPAQGRAWRWAGLIELTAGRTQEARAAFEASRDIFAGLGDEIWQARAMAEMSRSIGGGRDQSELMRAAVDLCLAAGAPDELTAQAWLRW